MQTEADARKWSDSTFLQLAEVFAFMGHSEREIGLDTDRSTTVTSRCSTASISRPEHCRPGATRRPAADDISQTHAVVQVRKLPQSFQSDTISVEGALRFSLAWVPEEHGGKGLLISVGGSTFKFGVDTGGAWAAHSDATFDAPFSIQLGGKTDNFQISSPNADPKCTSASRSHRRRCRPASAVFAFCPSAAITVSTLAASRCPVRSRATTRASSSPSTIAASRSTAHRSSDFIGSMLPIKQTSVEFTLRRLAPPRAMACSRPAICRS
jgi:hypothetical protein